MQFLTTGTEVLLSRFVGQSSAQVDGHFAALLPQKAVLPVDRVSRRSYFEMVYILSIEIAMASQ